MEDKFSALLKRLEAVTTKLETMPAPAAAGAVGSSAPPVDVSDDGPLPPMVVAYDAFISGPVEAFVKCASAISMPEVSPHALRRP